MFLTVVPGLVMMDSLRLFIWLSSRLLHWRFGPSFDGRARGRRSGEAVGVQVVWSCVTSMTQGVEQDEGRSDLLEDETTHRGEFLIVARG